MHEKTWILFGTNWNSKEDKVGDRIGSIKGHQQFISLETVNQIILQQRKQKVVCKDSI